MTFHSPNPSPLLTANAWSRFFHSWVSSLLTKSQKQSTLNFSDLYDIPHHLESSKVTEQLETSWLNELKRNPHNPSLIRATLRSMGWTPFLIGLLLIPITLTHIIQPLLIIYFMDFFEQCSKMSNWMAWLLAIANILITLCSSLLMHQYIYRTGIHAMKMRIAYSGIIFRKVLHLSNHSAYSFSSGSIVSLMANDSGQIEMALYFINYLWITPFEMILVVICFWKFIRYMIFIAICYAFLLFFVQAFCSRLILYVRTRILRATDERVKIINEIIKSIRIIKMYCWESTFINKVQLIRKREMILYIFRVILDCIQTLLSHTYISITLLMIYTIVWLFHIQFDMRFFVITMCMLIHIRSSAVHYFTLAIRCLVLYLAAQKRIQKFLLLPESENRNQLISASVNKMIEEDLTKELPRVICNIVRAQWEKDTSFCLKDITFNAHPGDLICVIGSVGSGKSSLLQTLSNEITHFDGKIQLCGSYCYVPQEPWIFSSSIKENILFGKEYDSKLFQRVIYATALDVDLIEWSHGFNTLVGDQGSMLSGGQKARVNMARALYRDADIYLLDDPLSAVDIKVSKHLFEKSIKEYLGNKICILATHQIQFLQEATKIIMLNNNGSVEIGSYEQLLNSSSSFAHLLKNIHQHISEEQDSTNQQNDLSTDDSFTSESVNEKSMLFPSTNNETKQEGRIKWNVYVSYLRTGLGFCLNFALMSIICMGREIIAIFSDRWLAMWSNDESHRYRLFENCTNITKDTIHSMTDVEWNNYRNQRFYIYCGTVLAIFVVSLFRVVIVEFICLNAGRVLHNNRMFCQFIRFPISFFDMNPIGRIMNRFTNDITILDDYLPISLFDLLQYLFKAIGIVLLIGWVNPWSFIPASIAVGNMIYIRHRYARCLRDVKRIEGISRSPFGSYLTSTIEGLKVIRSYHAGKISNYLICTINRWAAIRFDWICLVFISFVTFLAVILRIYQTQISAADIALILPYSLNLMGTLQLAIRLSVDVEAQMTAVERVVDYCSLDQELSTQVSSNRRPPTNWPSKGRIVFNNVSMCHSTDAQSPLALRHISMTIESGEKIGIVGRTGAGKSSLIQSLFRMGTLVEGQIRIDDIDIVSIGLSDVRSRISIISQNPILFTGTIRSNLDPFGHYSDCELWNALEQVELKPLVAKEMSNGLQSTINENGSNLSVGQKQLLCLARAFLKKNKILVMDETTANVDNLMDEIIQRTICEKFRDCTVLTVAHRLRTVINSDRIMVLNNGELLEFDSPNALLSNPTSHFTSLVEQAGTTEAEHLRMLVNVVSNNHTNEETE
ncbi:hypothetical protein I4U23_027723 [Adineta vaga]|nr:hypothetical protein I4U23_027723 [Adineta vaga]